MTPLRFIHMSDTHFGPSEDYELYETNTLKAFERLLKAISDLPFTPDFVLHTGDVAYDPVPEAVQYAAAQLKRINLPLYPVVGNHDAPGDLRPFVPSSNVTWLDTERLCYRVDFATARLIVLDGKGPDEINPRGDLPEPQFEILDKQLAESSTPVVVAIHFPPFDLDTPWLNDMMLLQNGERLHQLLSNHSAKVRGVFFGHIHRGMQIHRDGILYSSVGSTFCNFRSYPGDTEPVFASGEGAFFNLVTVTPSHTLIKQYRLG